MPKTGIEPARPLRALGPEEMRPNRGGEKSFSPGKKSAFSYACIENRHSAIRENPWGGVDCGMARAEDEINKERGPL